MSKKKQDFWQTCEICDRLIYIRHFDDHKALCEGHVSECSQEYCYIQDGVFHGRAQKIDSGGKMMGGKLV